MSGDKKFLVEVTVGLKDWAEEDGRYRLEAINPAMFAALVAETLYYDAKERTDQIWTVINVLPVEQ